MRKITELTDQNLLGLPGWANAKPSYKARAILKNCDGLYAIMYESKFGIYMLPGGGMEEDEDILDTLKREMLEETGCSCDAIEELGFVYENRGHSNLEQYTYYYIVSSRGTPQTVRLTDQEKENGTVLLWHTIDEIISLIRDFEPQTNQQKFLQARDMAALMAYKKNELTCGGKNAG